MPPILPNIEKIYIVHYKPLEDRKNYLTKYFRDHNITNYEFRDLYQRENLTKEQIQTYFRNTKCNLNAAQICITIEHVEIYKKIIEANKDGWYLILEDDAVFCDNFADRLNEYLREMPIDTDYLDISDFLIRHYNPNPIGKWTKIPTTRTNTAYLINKKTCEKLLPTIIPFHDAIDHELNDQIKMHNLNVYHVDHPLVYIGNYKMSYSYGNFVEV